MEISNFLLNLLPQSKSINSQVVSSLCVISTKELSCSIHCIKNLDVLIKTDSNTFLPEILVRVRQLNLEKVAMLDKDCLNSFVKTVVDYTIKEKDLKMTEISSLLYLIELFCDNVDNAPFIIEDIVSQDDRSEWNVELYSQLLSTTFRVFLTYPPSTQL